MEETNITREQKVSALPAFKEWPPRPITTYALWWTVLRCPSQATLDMAQELRARGYLVWSPSTRYQKRFPRSRKTQWVVAPLMPSFLFVSAEDADDAIMAMGRLSLFLVNDKRPHIPAHQLLPLQDAQVRGMGADMGALDPGVRVEVLSGLFGHQMATVVRPKGKRAFEVQMDGHHKSVVLQGFLLRPI